jgi:6-phosphofructokinase 1
VLIGLNEGSGFMSTILREPGAAYRVRYDKAPLPLVANSERAFPQAWIAPNRMDVTDEFIRYARPLIGNEWVKIPIDENGLQRYTRFQPIFAPKKCKPYVPMAYR